LPLLSEWSDAPVYGLPFTLALARRRLEEAGLSASRLVEARRAETVAAGNFRFTFFRVSHSVPDSAALLVETGSSRIFHSGDFKLDPDPPDGETTDLSEIASAVGEGVDLALVDSTNAERPGRALSGRIAGQGLAAAFEGAPGRIILTTFSSHVARVSQAVDAAASIGRKVAMLGRSMRSVAEIAERFGRLQIPASSRIAPGELQETPADRVLCLTSGSQGEPFSALYRLAIDEHADLKLGRGDRVLFSSRTIPGHERSVNRVTDHLVRRGAQVLRETDPPIHVSGHAHEDDLADWLALVKPRAVLPVHGEVRMLAAAAEIARGRGISGDRVPLLDNGDRLTLTGPEIRVERAAVPTGKIFLDSRPEAVGLEVVRRTPLGRRDAAARFRAGRRPLRRDGPRRNPRGGRRLFPQDARRGRRRALFPQSGAENGVVEARHSRHRGDHPDRNRRPPVEAGHRRIEDGSAVRRIDGNPDRPLPAALRLRAREGAGSRLDHRLGRHPDRHSPGPRGSAGSFAIRVDDRVRAARRARAPPVRGFFVPDPDRGGGLLGV